MHKRIDAIGLVCVGILLLLIVPTSQAKGALITLTSADGQGADARIRGGTVANSALGASEFLAIQFASGLQDSRKTYLRFDLATVGAPVTDVELQLISTINFAGPVTFDVYGLNDLDAGESWAENSITWNNAPQNNTTSGNGFLAGATLLGSTTFTSISDGGIVSFSYPSMAAFLNADSNNLVTFMLASNAIGAINYTFSSKENFESDPFPTLLVTTADATAAVPEPGSFAMLGLLLLSFCGYASLRRFRPAGTA